MAYRALYREYRPKLFSEVIGQDHITTALKNQIASGHVSHAYLFCGTRGTGKTSTAKILARAFNCLHPVNGEPCMECEACRAAADPANTDIRELDAASNTSVDDARALIEQAQYAPMALRCRVFIIDEVHMLSRSAFNALLKTLEEPPPHVRFILATTEPQKLPATIISRCQRFDFHRLTTADIVSNLRTVLKKAGASIDDEGLLLIARAADGGMRDALSLTDQCLSFIGDRVTAADVYDVLGSMDRSFMAGFVDRILEGDAARVLSLLNDALMQGRDLTVFTEDLISYFRSLLFAAACGRCEDLLDCTPDDMDVFLRQASAAGAARARFALDTLIDAENRMRFLPSPRTAVESALLRICAPEEEHTLEGLHMRLLKLERQGPAAPAPVAVQRPSAPQARPTKPVIPAAPAEQGNTQTQMPAPESAPVRQPSASQARTDAVLSRVAVDNVPAAVPDDPAIRAQTRTPVPEPAPVWQPSAPQAEAHAALSQTIADNTPAAGAAVPDDPAIRAQMLWNRILEMLIREDRMVGMVARWGHAVSYENGTLTIGFPPGSDAKIETFSRMLDKRRQAVDAISPGLVLRVVPNVPLPPVTDEEVERLRGMFGEKLIVED